MGVGGTGTLSGVSSLTSTENSYCALLTSGGVDCWGNGFNGQLGNGTFYPNSPHFGSATPVQVVGVGGTGTLSGVSSLASGSDVAEPQSGYCALLTSGGVDCWGYGYFGQLGNGIFYHGPNLGSASPVQVVGVGGTGALSGVSSLTGDSVGYCALLTAGGVDCWGQGGSGQLGSGTFYITGSATPVQVVGVGGTGTLSGVSSLASDNAGYCALLTSGGVDCWGDGENGQLGNGTFYTSGNDGSATPVQVVGVGGTGTLSGVSSLTSTEYSYCALLTSGGVDRWGQGGSGQLGDGTFYTSGNDGSATPVQVVGVGGTGTLSGVSSLTSTEYSYCALLTAGGVDCWGNGIDGQLGNGTINTSGSATPVQVVGVGGTGTLSGISSLTGGLDGYCALLTSGGVDCWGYNVSGELGNGTTISSDVPVVVEFTDTIAFNPEGGSSVGSISGPDGSSITLPADTYPGYAFNGWFTSSSGGSEVGAAGSSYIIPSGGITLFAQWTPNATDTVTFNSQGGSAVASGSGLEGTTIALPAAPSYPGHGFDGWFAAPSGGTALTSPYTLAGSVTLYAQWTADPTTAMLIPSKGATLSGSTYLDASATNATSVVFVLFGGTYGFSGQVLCTASPTPYGWLCSWNTATVPDGNYTVVSYVSNSAGTAISSGVGIRVNNTNSLPTTKVLVPSNGATLSGSTYLDASAANASSVVFVLFGGTYGFSGQVLCTATPTLYGWLCSWNTATVPDGNYTLTSVATNSAGTIFGTGVVITVKN